MKNMEIRDDGGRAARRGLLCVLGLCLGRMTGRIAPLGRVLAVERCCPKCGRRSWTKV